MMGLFKEKKKAVLSQGEPCNAAANFDIYRILQHVRFPCHSTAFLLVFVCRLQWIICQSDTYYTKNQSDRIFNADKFITWSLSVTTAIIMHRL